MGDVESPQNGGCDQRPGERARNHKLDDLSLAKGENWLRGPEIAGGFIFFAIGCAFSESGNHIGAFICYFLSAECGLLLLCDWAKNLRFIKHYVRSVVLASVVVSGVFVYLVFGAERKPDLEPKMELMVATSHMPSVRISLDPALQPNADGGVRFDGKTPILVVPVLSSESIPILLQFAIFNNSGFGSELTIESPELMLSLPEKSNFKAQSGWILDGPTQVQGLDSRVQFVWRTPRGDILPHEADPAPIIEFHNAGIFISEGGGSGIPIKIIARAKNMHPKTYAFKLEIEREEPNEKSLLPPQLITQLPTEPGGHWIPLTTGT